MTEIVEILDVERAYRSGTLPCGFQNGA